MKPYCTKEQKERLLELYNYPHPTITDKKDHPFIFKPMERGVIMGKINRMDEAEATHYIAFLEKRIAKLTGVQPENKAA